MKITLDSIVFGLQRFGGISAYWDRLVHHMCTSSAWRSELVFPKRLLSADIDPNRYGVPQLRTELLPTQVSRYLDVAVRDDCEIFHTSYYRVPSQRRLRYVVTVYDFIYERYGRGLSRSVHSLQKFRSIRRADAIICISNSTRDDLLRFMPMVDPARVHAVHLGVDGETYFEDPQDSETDIARTVLYVGQRRGHKRFDLAVDALARCTDLRLGIVGPTLSQEERDYLESALPGRWAWYGPVPRARLRRLYSSAFALIYPSDYEGFGLPILEAMACGCPVVAAKTSSLTEVGGHVALFAESQSPECFAAALHLLGSSEVRLRAKREGISHAITFTWDKTFEQTCAIYRGGV